MGYQKNLGWLCAMMLLLCQSTYTQNGKEAANKGLTWTYTYLKAKEGQKAILRETIVKNWFVMDSIAQSQGLIKQYELLENMSDAKPTEWDYIVAVEYFTAGNYSDIAEAFEKIREAHETVKIDGMTFSEVGSVVKSELVKKE